MGLDDAHRKLNWAKSFYQRFSDICSEFIKKTTSNPGGSFFEIFDFIRRDLCARFLMVKPELDNDQKQQYQGDDQDQHKE
jgi:hypothetical protein